MKRAFRIISEWLHTPVHIFWPVRHIFSTLQWHQETPASFWLISMWWWWNVTCWIRSLLTGSDLVRLIQERDPLQAKEATTGPNPKTSTTCYTSFFPVAIKIYVIIYPGRYSYSYKQNCTHFPGTLFNENNSVIFWKVWHVPPGEILWFD